jgi:hypothetical protein
MSNAPTAHSTVHATAHSAAHGSAVHAFPAQAGGAANGKARAWRSPSYELIPLDCEITAYAPDGGSPLV